MTPQEFVKAYYPYAKQTEDKTGILAVCILAQAALESGWGKHAPGNMFFGVKDFDGVTGDEQLLRTFEYRDTATDSAKAAGLVTIEKIEPVTQNGRKRFKYTGKSYFKKYETPEGSFTHHAKVLQTTKLKNGQLRYGKALAVKSDPAKFFAELQAAGYAQSDVYAQQLTKIVQTIKKYV